MKTAFQGSNQRVEKLPHRKWCLTITYRRSKQASLLPSLSSSVSMATTPPAFSMMSVPLPLSVSSSLCSLTILQEALDVYFILDKPLDCNSEQVLDFYNILAVLRFHITSHACVSAFVELMKLINQSIFHLLP